MVAPTRAANIYFHWWQQNNQQNQYQKINLRDFVVPCRTLTLTNDVVHKVRSTLLKSYQQPS